MQKERYQSQINQNYGTVCHTEVCLTFSRLGAKFSGTIAKFQGRSLKIQHQLSFDLNNLKNGPSFTVPLGDCLETKKVTAIIIKHRFGFAIRTT